jgi:ubiquinone/menaquinone biosynthesis C-methylase UbiE
MNLKKTFERIKLVLVNLLKQVLGQILTLMLSFFIFKFYSKELWGEFAAYFLYINIITIVIGWGNKEYLIREFSKAPGKISGNFYLIFNSRLILLAAAIIAVLFVFPTDCFWFFALWIISVYISQSLEVFWIYKRNYIQSILIEILSFSLLIFLLYYNKIDSDSLVGYYAYYQLARTVLYVVMYHSELKKMHFQIDKKYFVATFSFFLLALVGFLQSRMDFVIVTFFEADQNIAVYQIITAFFILIHALGTFLIFPYMKNIYRLQKSSVAVFQRFVSFISPLVVCFCLAVFFLITHFVYNLSLDYQYYLLGFFITFPPYLYTVKILILYKENKQAVVLKIGIIGIIINSVLSILLLYLGYGLKGALLASAVSHLFVAYQYLTHFSKTHKASNNNHIKKQNIGYYDNIAADYDSILNESAKTVFVRQEMTDKLVTFVPEGIVLDFGGGTGEDLKWLLANDYSVIFCEPSSGMREIAMGKFPDSNITFLEDNQTDFTTWNAALPFEEEVNGVIANFAVLNCISGLDQFFKNLALVMAPKAQAFLMVLDFSLKSKILTNPLKAMKSLILDDTMGIQVEFHGQQQLVYLHSVKSIQRASAGHFDFKSCEHLKAEGFLLIHLIKK